MTLCIAAACRDYESDEHRIIFAADERAEVGWAGGNVAFKYIWASKNWGMLTAGELSKAQDLVGTYRNLIGYEETEPLTRDNYLDRFNDVSSAHKEKLCRRFVRQRFGIDFDRFLAEGESALPADVRSRAFHELEQLEFGCEVVFLGFTSVTGANGEINSHPRLIEIDRFGEVFAHQNFGAVGTGAVIAKSTLYQREQHYLRPIEATLYNIYEASKLAAETAPSVGEIRHFYILSPPTKERQEVAISYLTDESLEVMAEIFAEVGPKPLPDIPAAAPSWFQEIPMQGKKTEPPPDEQAIQEDVVNPPSDSQTSEGQQ